MTCIVSIEQIQAVCYIASAATQGPEVTWRRMGSVHKEYRKTDYSSDAYKDFEDRATELDRKRRLKEPNGHFFETFSYTKPYTKYLGRRVECI